MGLMQREKGKAFERKIAAELRKHWPEATVRRSSQAERAYQSDVFIEGGPALLDRLWLECEDARNPDPRKKLAQADRDVARLKNHAVAATPTTDDVRKASAGFGAIPVVIWHRLRERAIWVTLRLGTLLAMIDHSLNSMNEVPVTMRLEDFLKILKQVAA